MPGLFDPITYGSIEAKNRILMAPLTRGRATKEGIPTDIMVEYYAQRASAGVIISEATAISRIGHGWPYAPGIYTKEQVEKWKDVTKAVHDKGGKIVLQLWHMGRVTHSDNLDGHLPVAPSALKVDMQMHTFNGKKDAEVPHALTIDEIKQTVKDYATATQNALDAGFDGVQIHGANGYLIDEFLRDSVNKRTDEYGGSIENRIRFLTEVTEAVIAVAGLDRTSIRLSPNGIVFGSTDSNHVELFSAVAKRLQELKLPSVELRETPEETTFGEGTKQVPVHKEFRELFKGKLILNQEYTKETAEKAIESGIADAISFGRPYIGNPDLVEKLKNGGPLRDGTKLVPWFYSRGPEGYIHFSD